MSAREAAAAARAAGGSAARGHLFALFTVVVSVSYTHLDVYKRQIQTLPEGFDTEINEDASNISQGQRQLLTIARAILADRRMLCLLYTSRCV